ncbi:hypothetical protein BH11MYX3_BH11MYX3_25650 [soil metagenome]
MAALPLLIASSARAGTLGAPVVDGSLVPPGKWPDAVAILGPDGSCTGTLVAPDVVLTAGHCSGIHATEVVANTTNYNGSGGQRIAIKSFTTYPDYQHTFDVAVIVLAKPVTGVAPRAVAKKCTYAGFADETMVHLVGFGLTQHDGGGSNTTLHEAVAPVLDAECTGGNGCRSGASPAGEFVAGGNGGDSCFGDSGGPVYLDTDRGPVLIASVSRGLDDAATPCGGGGIYVRTDKVLAWIEDTTDRAIAQDSCTGDGELASGGPGSDDGGGADRAAFNGGCSTSGGSAGALMLLAVIGSLRFRRRTR